MFVIKPYSKTYQDSYCDLYSDTWKAEPYGELFKRDDIIEHLVKNTDYHYLLIEDLDDEPVGFVAGRPILHECGFFVNEVNIDLTTGFYIDELGVAPAHRKHGWAQVLMHFLMSCAREQNFNEFVLRTHSDKDNPALRLYEKLGFSTRLTTTGVHRVETQQARIDKRPDIDFRIYFYKELHRKP